MQACSTGSPASRRLMKFTPLTTRPACTSRHGIIRLASIRQSFLGKNPGSSVRPPAGTAKLLLRGVIRAVTEHSIRGRSSVSMSCAQRSCASLGICCAHSRDCPRSGVRHLPLGRHAHNQSPARMISRTRTTLSSTGHITGVNTGGPPEAAHWISRIDGWSAAISFFWEKGYDAASSSRSQSWRSGDRHLPCWPGTCIVPTARTHESCCWHSLWSLPGSGRPHLVFNHRRQDRRGFPGRWRSPRT